MRRGAWLQTYTGRQFWPLDPRPEDIDIQDIAHALSLQCRFAGHCRCHYSVAEHSLRVAQRLQTTGADARTALWGLLHDASEAYLVDLPRPLKRLPEFTAYVDAESALMRCVCQRFGLPLEEPPEVRRADGVLLATEARDLMGRAPASWASMPEPLQQRLTPVSSPQRAEQDFLREFQRLLAMTPSPG